MNRTVATVIAITADARDIAQREAAKLRELQRQREWPLFTAADYAEGSLAAYSYIVAVLAGAFGFSGNVDGMIANARDVLNPNPDPIPTDLGPVEGTTNRDAAFATTSWPIDHAEGE